MQGFYQAIVAARVNRNVLAKDPLAASWAKDLPHPEDREATLWLRRTLNRNTGEKPSPGQAACWLDIKRTYLELRPRLRWVYTCYRDAELYRRPFQQLGLRLMDEGPPTLTERCITRFASMWEQILWMAGLLTCWRWKRAPCQPKRPTVLQCWMKTRVSWS